MELKFLGIGNSTSPLGNTSAYYYTDKNKTFNLLDCGELIANKIINSDPNLLEGVTRINVYITHNHADHVGSLATLILHCVYTLGIHPHVYAGDVSTSELLRIMGCQRDTYYFHFGRIYMKTNHASELPSHAIVMKDHKFIFTGDQNDPELIKKIVEEYPDYDVYVDCALKGSSVHMGMTELERLVPKELRSRWHIMHYSDKPSKYPKNGFVQTKIFEGKKRFLW